MNIWSPYFWSSSLACTWVPFRRAQKCPAIVNSTVCDLHPHAVQPPFSPLVCMTDISTSCLSCLRTFLCDFCCCSEAHAISAVGRVGCINSWLFWGVQSFVLPPLVDSMLSQKHWFHYFRYHFCVLEEGDWGSPAPPRRLSWRCSTLQWAFIFASSHR